MLDLAIVDSPFPGNEFNSLLLDTDYLTAAVPNGSPLADAGHISLAQLKKEKLILRPGRLRNADAVRGEPEEARDEP